MGQWLQPTVRERPAPCESPHCVICPGKKGARREENGRKSAVFWGSAVLSGVPPGAMTAVQGGGFVSVSVCACAAGGGRFDRFFCEAGFGSEWREGLGVGEGRFCDAVMSVGDGVSRHRRGVIVPTPFCLHTLLALNGRIKANA